MNLVNGLTTLKIYLNFNFQMNYKFTFAKQEFRDDENVEFKISLEQDSEDVEFLIFKVNLGELHHNTESSISNLGRGNWI